MDRLYQFNHVPEELNGCIHIMPHGNDKLISEDDECFSFIVDEDVNVYILYPDKQPDIPKWMESYERVRMNVTRMDSTTCDLKGYFGIYKKKFAKGLITLYGNSPNRMLEQDWYVSSNGFRYCMYSVVLKNAQ